MPDATALAAAINEGQVTARAAMEASLSAAATRADLGAVVFLDEDMGRAGAAAADAMPADRRGPFHGVPFLVKDLGGVAKGLPQAAGSAELGRRAKVPGADSDLIAALRNAGLIPFGVTATPPFGLSLTCEPDGSPPARNPWDRSLTPGGSSGGAAAAVAGGIVAIAHATDAAGSIRVPAACCGLTGLKPSRGAVPAGPDFSNYLMGIASELVLARSLRDVETAFLAVRRTLPEVSLSDKPRIGLAIPDGCADRQAHAVQDAAAALGEAGCAIEEIASPDRMGAQALDLARTILAVSLADWLGSLDIASKDVPPLAAAVAEEGRACVATTLFAASREVARLTNAATALFDDVDVMLTPTLRTDPLPVGALDLSGSDAAAHWARMAAFAPNAALANVAGLPALALPFGMANGLPTGVQLVGPQGSDRALLKLGAMIEARAPALSFPFPVAGLPQ